VAVQPSDRSPATWPAWAVRLRRAVNLATLATPLGLLLAARHGVAVEPGPYGTWIARDYPRTFPAPRASAVTIGDVVLLRAGPAHLAGHPRLLDHEARHSVQWACCLGPAVFLPAYLLACAWSWLRTGDVARENWFEVRANLGDGGYL